MHFLENSHHHPKLPYFLTVICYVDHLPLTLRSCHPLDQKLQLLVTSKSATPPPPCHNLHLIVSIISGSSETSCRLVDLPPDTFFAVLIAWRRVSREVNSIDSDHDWLIDNVLALHFVERPILKSVGVAWVVAESSGAVNHDSLLFLKSLADDLAHDGFGENAKQYLLLNTSVLQDSSSKMVICEIDHYPLSAVIFYRGCFYILDFDSS